MKNTQPRPYLSTLLLATLFAGGSLGLSCQATSPGSSDAADDDRHGGAGASGASGSGQSREGGASGQGGGDDQGGQGGEDNTGGADAKGGAGGHAEGGSEDGGRGGSTPGVTGVCDPDGWRATHKGGIVGPSAVWSGPAGSGRPYEKKTLGGAQIWIPGAYQDAPNGSVAITFISEAMADNRLEAVSSRMIAAGYIPPMVYAVGGINWAQASNNGGTNVVARASALSNLLDTIRGAYPKISTDPKMHAVAGQSTAGAVAFDLGWARPDLFGKILGASASFACFQSWLYPYPNNINNSKRTQLRIALDVGQCDLVGSQGEIPTACQTLCGRTNCICQGCCNGNWPQFNRQTAQRLLDQGYETQLVIRAVGTHNVWTAAIADDLAFLWRDVVCQ